MALYAALVQGRRTLASVTDQLRQNVARAVACFDQSDDIAALHALLEEVAPRAKKAIGQYVRTGGEDAIPAPAEIGPARDAASLAEATVTLRSTNDFPLLLAMSRSIGRRVEAIEIASSAEFREGSRVLVPAQPRYPISGPRVPGTVREPGIMLDVLLDDGESWRGPASLARLQPTSR